MPDNIRAELVENENFFWMPISTLENEALEATEVEMQSVETRALFVAQCRS